MWTRPAMIAATSVPWVLSQPALGLAGTMLTPGSNWPASFGWVPEMPESMTATTTPLPVLIGHASSGWSRCSGHGTWSRVSVRLSPHSMPAGAAAAGATGASRPATTTAPAIATARRYTPFRTT